MPSQPLTTLTARALGLTRRQVIEICRLGDIHLSTRTQAIRAVKAVRLTLWQASGIWGYAVGGRMLWRYVQPEDGRLVVCETKPWRVTVAAMLDLMVAIIRPASGFGK